MVIQYCSRYKDDKDTSFNVSLALHVKQLIFDLSCIVLAKRNAVVRQELIDL